MSMASRIAAAISHALNAGKKAKDLAVELGVKEPRITQLKEGRCGINADKIYRLARATGFRAEWIVEGTGAMFDRVQDHQIGIPYYSDHPEPEKNIQMLTTSILEHHGLKGSEEGLLAFIAKDNTMTPTFDANDIIFIDTQKTQPESGGIYALKLEHEKLPLLRRLIRTISGRWLVRADTLEKTSYPDEFLNPESLHELKIIGKVVLVISRA